MHLMYLGEELCSVMSCLLGYLTSIMPLSVADVSYWLFSWLFSIHSSLLPSLPQIYSLTISALVWKDDLCGVHHLGSLAL